MPDFLRGFLKENLHKTIGNEWKYFKWPFDELEDVEHKYDYAKLSKDI